MMTIPVNYKVDKGVPIPVERHTVPIDKLEVGESILFPKPERAKVQSYASRLRERKGKIFTVRAVDNKNCRVWRTK